MAKRWAGRALFTRNRVAFSGKIDPAPPTVVTRSAAPRFWSGGGGYTAAPWICDHQRMGTIRKSRAKPKASRSKDALERYHTPPPEDAPPLLFGPYHPPACRIGDWLNDEVLGLVEVSGWTDGPICWPKRKRPGLPTIIFTDELVRAIRSESARAVAGAWGVTPSTVSNWRRALDVDRITQGTRQLLQTNYDAEQGAAASAKGRATIAANPAIREAIADKKRGVKHSAEARRKISAGQKGRPKAEGWGAKANAWMLEGKAKRK